MSDDNSPPDTDLSTAEIDALHDLQLAREHIYRAYGTLLTFHHRIGRAMNHYNKAIEQLENAGHTDLVEEELIEPVALGVINDRWTWSLVEEFEDGFFTQTLAAEARVRDELADGDRHINERLLEQEWRERATRRTNTATSESHDQD